MSARMFGVLGLFLAGTALAQTPAVVRPQSTPPAAPPAAAATPTVDTTTLGPQEIGTITLGQTRNGLLEVGDYTMGDATWADVWYLNLAAGQRVQIDLGSTQFDPYMQLLDPWGGKVGEDDDGGPGSSSRLVFTAREAGRYQIVVNCSGDSPRTGRYVLSAH
jgi:hypothetical protein